MREPLSNRPKITEKEILQGHVLRYFVKSVSSRKIIEVDKSQYDIFKNDPYYTTVQLKWVITGAANDIVSQDGTLVYGAAHQNTVTLNRYTSIMPGLDRVLSNRLEYFNGNVRSTTYVTAKVGTPLPPGPLYTTTTTTTLPPTREYQTQFQRQFGTNILESPILISSSVNLRPDAISFDYKTAFTLGPTTIGAGNQGLFDRVWKVWDDGNNNVWYAGAVGATWSAAQLLFSYAGSPIIELDVAFEQLGRFNIVAQRNTGAAFAPEVWTYWFDPILNSFSFKNIGAGRTPRISLDDWQTVAASDVLIFYVNDAENRISYRAQKDAFDIGYNTPIVTSQNIYLEKVGFARDYRYRVTYSERNAVSGKYSIKQLASKRYPIVTPAESYFTTGSFVTAEVNDLVITSSVYDPESYFTTGSFVTASIREIIVTSSVYDPESYFTTGSFVTASIREIIITSSVYDPESYFTTGSFVTASTLEILVTRSMYDPESYFTTGSFVTAEIVIP